MQHTNEKHDFLSNVNGNILLVEIRTARNNEIRHGIF